MSSSSASQSSLRSVAPWFRTLCVGLLTYFCWHQSFYNLLHWLGLEVSALIAVQPFEKEAADHHNVCKCPCFLVREGLEFWIFCEVFHGEREVMASPVAAWEKPSYVKSDHLNRSSEGEVMHRVQSSGFGASVRHRVVSPFAHSLYLVLKLQPIVSLPDFLDCFFWLPVFHRVAKQASLQALPSPCWNEWLSDPFWIFHLLTPSDVTARPVLIQGTSNKLSCSFNWSPCHRWPSTMDVFQSPSCVVTPEVFCSQVNPQQDHVLQGFGGRTKFYPTFLCQS